MPHATLLVIHGVDQGSRFELRDQPVGIGRGVGNVIRVQDSEVSRQHAQLTCLDGEYVVSDRNSSNGTFVNGQPVREKRLVSGDRIQIGRSVMLFSAADAADLSSLASDRVDFVGRHGADDRAHIVAEVAGDSGRTLLDGSPAHDDGRALARTIANLQTLYRISEETVTASIPLDQMLQRVLDLSIGVVGADRGCLLLFDPQSGELSARLFSQRAETDVATKMPVSRSIVDYVVQTKQAVRTSDARKDERFDPGKSILQARIREAICVPLQGRYELLGAIYVDTTSPPGQSSLGIGGHKFSDDQLRLLAAIGRQSALAVENNRYQQAFVHAERLAAMGQTIAMLSHHIKNILQGVRGGSYLIDMGLRDHNEELVRKGWGIVEKNQGKIYHLVMDMLTFSKEREPALESADLNATVQDACELMQTRADEAGVRLETRLDEDVPITPFDAEGIHRAVLNIVINAIDAVEGRDGGAVVVQTGHEPRTDELYVAVVDNGPGIAPEMLKKVFNVFESTKGARGTGLGLAVSRKILREHGGDIAVESRVGEGCRFTLSWPRIDDEHRSESTTRA